MRTVSITVTLAVVMAGGLLSGQTDRPARSATQAPAPPSAQTAPAAQTASAKQELSADQQAVLRTLREIAHAQFKKDPASFRRLTAEEFVHFDADGSLTNKLDWLRIIEDEPQRFTTPPEPLDAPLQLPPGTLVRVVDTTAVVVSTPPAAVKDQNVRIVTVLVKRDGGWQQLLVNRQVIERPSA